MAGWERELKGAGQVAALNEMDSEFANLLAAWEWAATEGDAARLDAAADALGLFCRWRVRSTDGARAFGLAVGRLGQDRAVRHVLAKLMAWQGEMAYALSLPAGEAILREAWALAEAIPASDENARHRAFAATNLARALKHPHPEHLAAWELAAHGVALYRQSGDAWGVADALAAQGETARLYRPYAEEVVACLQEAMSLYEELGDPRGRIHALTRLVGKTLAYADREPMFREAIALGDEIGDRYVVLSTLSELAFLLSGEGRREEAYATHKRAMQVAEEVGYYEHLLLQMPVYSISLFALGRLDEALALADQAESLSRRLRDPRSRHLAPWFRGIVHLQRGQYKDAERCLATAEALVSSQTGYYWTVDSSA